VYIGRLNLKNNVNSRATKENPKRDNS